jgi:hypothetical protein
LAFHRIAQVAQHLEARWHGAVEIFRIFLDRVAAFFLGAVQCDIGVFQDLIGVDAVIGKVDTPMDVRTWKVFVEHFERFGA